MRMKATTTRPTRAPIRSVSTRKTCSSRSCTRSVQWRTGDFQVVRSCGSSCMAWRVLPGFSISYYDMKHDPARNAGGNTAGDGVVYTEKRRVVRHHSLRKEESLRESDYCVAAGVGCAAGYGTVV